MKEHVPSIVAKVPLISKDHNSQRRKEKGVLAMLVSHSVAKRTAPPTHLLSQPSSNSVQSILTHISCCKTVSVQAGNLSAGHCKASHFTEGGEHKAMRYNWLCNTSNGSKVLEA